MVPTSPHSAANSSLPSSAVSSPSSSAGNTAVDFDESPEGHALRFGPNGELVGITIVGARHLLESGGPLEITIPVPEHVAVDPEQLASAIRVA